MKPSHALLAALTLLATGLIAALGLGFWAATSRVSALERRLELREQTLHACQLTVDAIGASGRVRQSDLEPHLAAHRLGAPRSFEGGASEWVVRAEGPPRDTTDHPELGLAFEDGVLRGAHAYKP